MIFFLVILNLFWADRFVFIEFVSELAANEHYKFMTPPYLESNLSLFINQRRSRLTALVVFWINFEPGWSGVSFVSDNFLLCLNYDKLT
ncbi:MAG: hypothetical protein A3C71_00585 [Candidatus Yanofskybacteria bacterium RIFCSPHIGHO2_02_FULL_43_15c]|uniref:Uncharacterized protein n=1 Tax=Candidatus Yanofskybacteria bacterium RIFCSPHIGHO2_02_FULL_43_15c TaxID=1802679 RepID=A0A1F8FIK8_9BACT|nr:MAG: hypothetical protein A3C71_00585 [Candidatus Yanofskybacteria bacterium RIFCSPHIGHO2_02_FULL_43_15c]